VSQKVSAEYKISSAVFASFYAIMTQEEGCGFGYKNEGTWRGKQSNFEESQSPTEMDLVDAINCYCMLVNE
jgi:hypothetical protein